MAFRQPLSFFYEAAPRHFSEAEPRKEIQLLNPRKGEAFPHWLGGWAAKNK
jgi:hypothetical protein